MKVGVYQSFTAKACTRKLKIAWSHGVYHTHILETEREDNNPMDKYSIAVLRDGVIVGHACSVKLMHSL